MDICPQCGCYLEKDHPGQAYCSFCNVIWEWVEGYGWRVKYFDEED